jgi:hypothetical protein
MTKYTLRWTFLLPLLQVIIAVSLWLYTPFDAVRTVERAFSLPRGAGIELSPEQVDLYDPPPMARVSYVTNFPGYVLSSLVANLFQARTMPARLFFIQDHGRNRTYEYSIDVRSASFFVFVCLLWAWVGSKLDLLIPRYRQQASPNIGDLHPNALGLSELAALSGLSAVLVWESFRVIIPHNCTPPDRQIYGLGLIWPAVFVAYISLRVRQLWRVRERRIAI